jgi:hypothetical protein
VPKRMLWIFIPKKPNIENRMHDKILLVKRPPICLFKERKEWQKRQDQNHSTTGIYNNGLTLHIDPHGSNADTYYGYPWKWIDRQEFCQENKHILIGPRRIAGVIPDTLEFQIVEHLGVATIKVRSGSVMRRMYIPPMCILYLSVLYGHVKDSLLVYQPLPVKLLPTGSR